MQPGYIIYFVLCALFPWILDDDAIFNFNVCHSPITLDSVYEEICCAELYGLPGSQYPIFVLSLERGQRATTNPQSLGEGLVPCKLPCESNDCGSMRHKQNPSVL